MTKDNKHQKLSDSTCNVQFYRYECQEYASHDYNGELIDSVYSNPKLELRTYDLLKETKKGYWIGYQDFSFKKWIPKKSKRRYAYPTQEEALTNFIAKTKRRVDILQRQIECCKISIALAERMVISPSSDNLRTYENEENLACGDYEDIVNEMWRITKDGGLKKAWEDKRKEMDIETTNFENFTADE